MKFKRKLSRTQWQNNLDQLEQQMIDGHYGSVLESLGSLKEKVERTKSVEMSRSFSDITLRAEHGINKIKEEINSLLILVEKSLSADNHENSDLKLKHYNARRELNQFHDKCNEENLGSDFKQIIEKTNKIKEKIDYFYSDLIKERIETGRSLTEQKKFDESIKIMKDIFKITVYIYDFKLRSELKEKIKSNSNLIYSAMIKAEIETSFELINKNKFEETIRKLENTFKIAKNIFDFKLRSSVIENLKTKSDLIYSAVIKKEIENSYELNNLKKFDESIKKLEHCFEICDKISNLRLQNESSEEINQLKSKIRIAKIKNSVLGLGMRFPRLQASDIAENCGEDEGLIVSTIKEMIVNEEIYAMYFENSKSVAFD